MIKYNPDRQQYEAWYIDWLDTPVMASCIYEGARAPSIDLWEKEWGQRIRELQNLHDLIKAAQLAKHNTIYQGD